MKQFRRWFSPRRPWFNDVNRQSLQADAMAGLTNAAVVVPQGVAFAVIAGMPPVYGLFTAMIPPIIAAIWGSSMIMISGPTVATSAILFATLSTMAPPETPAYVNLALIVTIIAGLFQLIAGVLRLGGVISFVSHSVMVGFTAAAALSIAASQIGGVFGISTERGGGVARQVLAVYQGRHDFQPLAIGIAVFTVGSIVLLQRLSKKLPAYLIALVVGAIAGELLGARQAGVAMFAELPTVIPSFHLPTMSPSMLAQTLPGAATLAFVGLLSAISIGRTFAIRRRERFDTNQEFVGQGLSNIVGGFFQCFGGAGSFTRSGLNAESGAKTPMSAIFAAIFLFLLLLVIAPFVSYVPVPAICGIILLVAWRLIDIGELRHIVQSSKSETTILATTFFAASITELDIGIMLGVIVSLFVFLIRMARPHIAAMAPAITNGRRHLRGAIFYDLHQCPEIMYLRIEGQLFFGSIEHVESEFRRLDALFPGRQIKILSIKGLGEIDLAGSDFLLDEIQNSRATGGDFHLVCSHVDVLRRLYRFHVIDILGAQNVHSTKARAIAAAVAQARDSVCEMCSLRNFLECANKPKPKGVEGSLAPKEVDDHYQAMQLRGWNRRIFGRL